ncbi:hypothetical protein LC607_20545 [Nostoc sp. CHAB 5824]|nr:hypothetical protein [Nostoc sp. CHAB 5824]
MLDLNLHPHLPPIGRGLKALTKCSFVTRTLEKGQVGQVRSPAGDSTCVYTIGYLFQRRLLTNPNE